MAHYDGPTKKFIEDVSEDQPLTKKDIIQRQSVGVLKDLLTSQRAELPKKLLKRTVGIATALKTEDLKKESSVNLFSYLNNKYGDSWHDWLPETLDQTLKADDLDHLTEFKDVIQAYQVVARTNFPFEEWHVFEKVGHAFNFNPVSFGWVQPLEMDDIALTVKVLQTVRPGTEFEDDIKAYIAASAKHSGMVYLPVTLFPEGCQQFLDRMGNDLVLRDLVAKNYPGHSQEETALGIQLARLSEIDDYVKE